MIGAERGIAANLRRAREAVADAATRAGRDPREITLIGISKTQPAEVVIEAIRAGLEHIGENRVQEAAAKLRAVRAALGAEPATFHLVGHLQSNKAGQAIEVFDRVDSVDSLKVAQALSRRVARERVLPVLLEVYVGDDPGRPGLRPEGLTEAVSAILEVPGLRVDGLMTVAPLGGDARRAFGRVRELKLSLASAFPRVHFGVLSMGMSEDFVSAIQEGATEVRLGTAVFGPRLPRVP